MSIQKKQLNIGLFGFGVVGEGVYKVLEQTRSLNACVRKICILHPDKQRNAPAALFTTNAAEILDDENINVVVELIDDAAAAYKYVCSALKSGKAVVTANKKMVATYFESLLALQKEYNVPLLYEAACCASIPVIRNLEEYYNNDLLKGLHGIVNGSTNYILTRMAEDKLEFEDALLQAQIAGFAESDPALDLQGEDAANKLSILLIHAFGWRQKPDQVLFAGITSIQQHDTIFAGERGYAIKLVAKAVKINDNEIAAFVLPAFVRKEDQLYHVKNEYNAVTIDSGLAEKQFFYGKGAGSFPTASAVLSDISALAYDYRYEYKKLNLGNKLRPANDFLLKVYISFQGLSQVPQDYFEQIEEWSSNKIRCYVIGIIKYSRLREGNWWRKPGTSLIVCPEAIPYRPSAIRIEKEEEVYA